MPDMPSRNSLVSNRRERDCCIGDDNGMLGVTKRLIKFLVERDESSLASLGTFFGILALDQNNVIDNALRNTVLQPSTWSIEVIEGDYVNINQVSIGSYINERGVQFLDLRGVTPDATHQLGVSSNHLVHVGVGKNMQTCVAP